MMAFLSWSDMAVALEHIERALAYSVEELDLERIGRSP